MITVTPEQLGTAVRVWLRLVPKFIWRDYLAQEALNKTKRQGLVQFDAREAVADYIVSKFQQAHWEIRHPRPQHLGSPPPWSGDR